MDRSERSEIPLGLPAYSLESFSLGCGTCKSPVPQPVASLVFPNPDPRSWQRYLSDLEGSEEGIRSSSVEGKMVLASFEKLPAHTLFAGGPGGEAGMVFARLEKSPAHRR